MPDVKAQLKQAWEAYQKTEKYGLAFGKALIAARKDSKRGEFLSTLKAFGIPISTAYWWMDRVSNPKRKKKKTNGGWSKKQKALYEMCSKLSAKAFKQFQAFVQLTPEQRETALVYIKQLAADLNANPKTVKETAVPAAEFTKAHHA
jgi:hypothetical protein